MLDKVTFLLFDRSLAHLIRILIIWMLISVFWVVSLGPFDTPLVNQRTLYHSDHLAFFLGCDGRSRGNPNAYGMCPRASFWEYRRIDLYTFRHQPI